jgi:protein tyrosine phosphatase (PTP) superfamily phosphohydrolase (DUF442 family)
MLRSLVAFALFLNFCLAAIAKPLSSTLNYQEINPNLLSMGQIDFDQIATLPEAQVDLVINLTQNPSDRMAREGYDISQLGINYVHIPVDWSSPADSDYKLFAQLLQAAGPQKVLVHCDANYRASAFIYLYRRLVLNTDEAQARADLDTIWEKEAWKAYPQWLDFIDQTLSQTDSPEGSNPGN